MIKVYVYILSGLGHVLSNGIIYNLAAMLVAIDGVSVRVGSYADYERFAEEIKALPADAHVIIVGHSLGASVAALLARMAGRLVACIYGFDPAENLAADASQYRLTPVPANVRKAVAFTVEGIGLGGGEYTADDPVTLLNPNGSTVLEKIVVRRSHTRVEEDIEDHLRIGALSRRLAAA